MLCEQYPPEACTNVYTDGSATNAIQDSRADIAIYLSSGSTKAASAATRRHHNKYRVSRVRGIGDGHLSQQKSTMAVFLTDVCHGKHIAII